MVVDALIATGSDDAFRRAARLQRRLGTHLRGDAEQLSYRWRLAVDGIGLPNTAVITAAYVELVQKAWGSGIETKLSFKAAASPATFTPASSPADRWASRTSFDIPWSWGPQTPGTLIQTPSLVAGIQQLVGAHGAVNEIVLLEDGSGLPTTSAARTRPDFVEYVLP